MQKETLKLSYIRQDLDLVAYHNISNIGEWRLYPSFGIILAAIVIGYYLGNIVIGVLISLASIPGLLHYFRERRNYQHQKQELTTALERGDISISVLKLSHISTETVYEPHTYGGDRHSTKQVKFFHFTSGSSWRLPAVSTHYEWSNKYYLSSQGLENISISGNEFYYISLQGYPEVSYVYPCSYFELDSELKVKE